MKKKSTYSLSVLSVHDTAVIDSTPEVLMSWEWMQLVVEKMLAAQGIRRTELGRKEFVNKVWEWKQKYEVPFFSCDILLLSFLPCLDDKMNSKIVIDVSVV